MVAIPSDFKDTVTFIFIGDPSGRNDHLPIGTGFFVTVESEKDPGQLVPYLITAKHVIVADRVKGDFMDSIFIRMNTQNGKYQFEEIFLAKNGFRILKHNEANVDIIAIQMLPDLKNHKWNHIPQNMITTKDLFREVNIREGDDVFFIGLFNTYYGNRRNYPIARFGRVALITDEKIPWEEAGRKTELIDAYLIECHSYGGNSGAPVFFYLGANREPGVLNTGPHQVLLAGVMKGCFTHPDEVRSEQGILSVHAYGNMGISAVTPAYHLYELLFSEDAIKERAEL